MARSVPSDKPLTLGEVALQVAPGSLANNVILRWPPDVFAVCGSILRHANAYERVLSDWPPDEYGNLDAWRSKVAEIGLAWASAAERIHKTDGALNASKKLTDLLDWWRVVRDARGMAAIDVRDNRALYHALICLTCAADEACSGIAKFLRGEAEGGLPSVLLGHLDSKKGRTLCKRIHRSRAVVLPKTHTPQIGLTLRSLTHHIALLPRVPVDTRWRTFSFLSPEDPLNLLLLPWPLEVLPRCFSEVGTKCCDETLPEEFKFFSFEVHEPLAIDLVVRCIESAEDLIGEGRLSAVVLPELAVQPGGAKQLAGRLTAKADRVVIAGEGNRASPGAYGENAAVIVGSPMLEVRQNKHHRWQLTRDQILQYGLGATLDPNHTWWECTQIAERQVNIWQLQNGVSFCVLICEDLARQDPVAEIIRSIGPSLVVVLLLDGPQLAARWSSRYATVLADDPGCSVLTLTNLGMASLSVPPGCDPSRAVALWREAGREGVRELTLDGGGKGLVVSLTHLEGRGEWTADGRLHRDAAAHVGLTGVHTVEPGESVPPISDTVGDPAEDSDAAGGDRGSTGPASPAEATGGARTSGDQRN